MRDKLLNETLLFGIQHAREAVAGWTYTYNAERPHSAIGFRPRRSLPPNSPQRAISFVRPKRSADRPLLHRCNRAKFNRRSWFQLDAHQGVAAVLLFRKGIVGGLARWMRRPL